MANRTVAVYLKAEVGSFVQGMKNAAAATKDLTSSTLQTAQKNREALTSTGAAALGLGAAVGAGVAVAVGKFANFDKAMSAVGAATHETTSNMNALRDAAMEAGARTAFSASEAAEGIEALAKAGVSTESILNGGLNGALDLAAAGALGVGDAAEIAATAMTQFGLAGDKVPHVADLLAAAAGKAQGEVSDMGMALKQAGLVANQTGLSIEETTAGLASFAAAGLLGSDAGTSFKSMLQRLTPQSEEAAGLMERLGISAYDAGGNFIGLEAFAGNLQTSLAGLTVEQRNSAMATIFGSDAVRAASVLYDQGAAGIAEWTDKVNDAGYASETAAMRLDNLSGDVEAFWGSVETALIKTGSAGNDLARGSVQTATSVINAYGSMPSSMQGAVLAVGGVTAALAGVSGAFLVALPRIASTREAMKDLRTEMPRTATAMGRVGRAAAGFAAFTAATQVLHGLILATSDSADGVETMTRRIMGSLAEVDKAFSDLDTWSEEVGGLEEALHLLADPGLANRLGDLGGEILTFGGNEGSFRRTAIIDQLGAMGDALAKLVSEGRAGLAAEKFAEFAEAAKRAGMDVNDLKSLMPAYGEALAGAANETALAATAEGKLGGAVSDATVDIKTQSEKLGELMEQVRGLSDLILDLRGSERDFESAVDAATESVKANGRTLDINSEKGRANEEALDAIASSANDVLESMIANGASMDDVSATMATQRERLVAAATAFGMTKEEANKYADSVLRIPTKRETTIALNGADSALTKLELFRQQIANIPSFKDVTIRYNEVQGITVRRPGGGVITERASGGWVPGNGGPRADDQLLLASSGEFVVNARSAQQNAALLEAINGNRFATGGWVSGRSGGALPAGMTSSTDNRQVAVTVNAQTGAGAHEIVDAAVFAARQGRF